MSVEDLNILFPELCDYGTKGLRRLGCLYPEQCAADAVTNYLLIRKPRLPGQIKVEGEQLTVNFRNAENQLSVLYTYVGYAVRSRRSRCEDCKRKKDRCGIAGDSPDHDEGNEPRTKRAVLISYKTPLEILEAKELVDKSLEVITNPLHKQYVIRHAEGKTCAEIGREFRRKTSTVRKAIHRATQKMTRALGVQRRRRRGK